MRFEMKMWTVTRNLVLVVFAGLANASVFADCPKPDTTKATVVDDRETTLICKVLDQ